MTLYQLFSYLLIEPFNPYYPTLHHTSKVLFLLLVSGKTFLSNSL